MNDDKSNNFSIQASEYAASTAVHYFGEESLVMRVKYDGSCSSKVVDNDDMRR